MNVTDFERRRNNILEAIVEAYLETASPVGSELISRKMRRQLSSATIRNVMGELEEAGLVEQPHTSAGRVPTDRGYRLYVDQLLEAVQLSADELQQLLALVHPDELELKQLFQRVGEVLAEQSHQATVILEPTVKHSRVKQIELLPVGVRKLLCVLVGQETLVVSHVIEVEQPISREEALSLAHFLTSELTGLPIQELLTSLEGRLSEVDASLADLAKRSLAILQTVLATEPEERLLLEGTLYLVEQPEFRKNPNKTHQLLRQLELRQALMAKMREELGSPRTCVRIGREINIEGLEACSYILAPFGVRQAVLGGIGVLGPKRMDYRRTRALVEGAADLLSDVLTQWELNG